MPAQRPPRPPHAARAFTLLELMIVFVIIAILIGVALMVGRKVVGGSKFKSTQNVLQTLDQALDAYASAKGGTNIRFPDRYIDAAKNEFPLADAAPAVGDTPYPSGELAVQMLLDEPRSASVLKGIPAEFIEQRAATAVGSATPVRAAASGNVTITYTRVKDAWGNPIRFVHPAYQGIYGTGAAPARTVTLTQNSAPVALQLFRDWAVVTGPDGTTCSGAGDGGLCTAGRPYFYSAGPDGNPATIDDNVYSNKPTFDAAVKAAGQ